LVRTLIQRATESTMKKVSVIIPLDLKMSCQDLFYALSASGRYEYISFLDSSLVPNRYSNCSYIAWKPEFVVKCDSLKNEIIFPESGLVKAKRQHPLLFLKKLFNSNLNKNNEKYYRKGRILEPFSSLPEETRKNLPDFTGGFIGYISYDLKNFIEKLPQSAADELKIPVFYFVWYSKLLAFNHISGLWYQVINMAVPYPAQSHLQKPQDPERICAESSDEVKELKNEIRVLENFCPVSVEKSIAGKYARQKIQKINLTSNFNRQDYIRSVERAKEFIHKGDIYQMNMTQRFKCGMDIDAHDLYYILRRKNPAPFSAFLGYPELKIGSSSPERFLFIKDGMIQTRPIKGTRPRGRDPEEDEKNMEELISSEKDRAELNMIVDLERNDLGKFCRYGTVKVQEHAVVEKYAKVFHLVSTVTGLIKKGYDMADIIKATFPGGSITGAPKIRAMELIDELEPTTRGVYTGSIGYIGHDLSMDLNIVIRTFIIKGRTFYYNVGGGIVEDSLAEQEYQETMDKGLALKETLEFFLYENLSKAKPH